MSERIVAVITQPCVLCEGDLEEWTVWHDGKKSLERIERKRLPHDCQPLKDLISERYRHVRNGRRIY